jgi:hypothetical protein
MSLRDDVADDWEDFDGEESSVTLHQVRPDGLQKVSITNAINGPLSRADVGALGSGFTGKARTWSINATEVGDEGVEIRDKIVAAGDDPDVWIVLQADLATMDSRWRCVCQLQE